MRYLKGFEKFNEEVDLEVKITDEPNLKMAKEKLNTLKKHLADYKVKKPLIDKAYLMAKTDADLTTQIESLLGKTDALPAQDRNPFLVEYLTVSNLKRKVQKLGDDILSDKLKKDSFKLDLKDAGPDLKDATNKKISDIDKRIGTNTSNIALIKKDIEDSQKKLDNKMIQVQKEMTDYIKKIGEEGKK